MSEILGTIPNGDDVMSMQETSFQARLARAGLVYKPVKEDGNMQFRALADQVYGTESAHTIVRLLVMSEILQNPSLYERHLQVESIDFEEYCAIMSRDGCCGDHLTLTAFANFYGADVMVYTPSFSHPMLIQSKRTLGKSLDVIRLAHGQENEWQSLGFPQNELLRARSIESLASQSKRPPSDDLGTLRVAKRARREIEQQVHMEVVATEEDVGTTRRTRACNGGPPSLTSLCLEKIVENIDTCMPPLQGLLPVDLLDAIIAYCTRRKKLNDAVCARLVDPSMTSISLKDHSGGITDMTVIDIARKCRQLQTLKLVNCVSVTNKAIVQVASNCSHLEHLILEGCSGIGDSAIQEVARKCPSLVSINLNGCVQVTDLSLQELQLACPYLTNIVLKNCNQLTDASINYIGKNTMMLDMSECEDVGDKALCSIAGRCANMRVLKILGHNLSDIGIVSLARGCKALVVLELTNCNNIHNEAIHTLVRCCNHLQRLSLESCRSIDDSAFIFNDASFIHDIDDPLEIDIDFSPAFSSLTSLNLSRCLKMSDAGIIGMARNCPNLQSLSLCALQEITDEGVVKIAEYCPHLREIDLSLCSKITDTSVMHLARSCPGLTKCVLFNCNLVTDMGVITLLGCCPQLRHVNVSCCVRLTDRSFEDIARSCPSLRHLFLEECNLSEAGLMYIKDCANLKTLKMGYSKALSDVVLEQLAEGCPHIRDLDLSYCNKISSTCLSRVLRSWYNLEQLNLRGFQGDVRTLQHSNLEQLNLSWCKLVDDNFIGTLAEGCPSLVVLDLAWNSKITGNSVHQLAAKCKSLRSLNLRGCNRVSMLTIQYLSGASSMVIYR